MIRRFWKQPKRKRGREKKGRHHFSLADSRFRAHILIVYDEDEWMWDDNGRLLW